MLSPKQTQQMISWILTIGTLISAAFVLLGGVLFLMQVGSHHMQEEVLQSRVIFTSLPQIWSAAWHLSPLGIVELGVILLIATQVLRVLLLVAFYASIHDVMFTCISIFIFLALMYSFFGKS